MDSFAITGGVPLKGRFEVQGGKNAVLPILAACLMVPGRVALRRVPDLADVHTMCRILEAVGAKTEGPKDGRLVVDTSKVARSRVPYDLVKRMRASFFILGPLLARMGRAEVSLPGGCAIGVRPVDIHLKGFSDLGIRIGRRGGYILASGRAEGREIAMDFPSVGATENLMMVAAMGEGTTVIQNAAKEPEIADLARFLSDCGARIEGEGTDSLRIDGVKRLKPVDYRIMGDRIEAGILAIAAAITRGEVSITGFDPVHIGVLVEKLRSAGVSLRRLQNGLCVKASGPVRAVDVRTMPYPGFPTDLQAPYMALMSVARGSCVINETIFEMRFMHAAELCRMGARIKTDGQQGAVTGVPSLSGAEVMASDIRAGTALVLAGLQAKGKTVIQRVYHIDRGHTDIVPRLARLGADIRRIK